MNARPPLEEEGRRGTTTDDGVDIQSTSVTDQLVSLLTGDVRLNAPVVV